MVSKGMAGSSLSSRNCRKWRERDREKSTETCLNRNTGSRGGEEKKIKTHVGGKIRGTWWLLWCDVKVKEEKGKLMRTARWVPDTEKKMQE